MRTQKELLAILHKKRAKVFDALFEDDFIGVRGLVSFGGISLQFMASNGDGWEHVSVSTKVRCPMWHEMAAIKEIFWQDSEAVMQLHPAKSEYVNNHPYCLHLWRPVNAEIPMPPSIMVGLKELNV
ncbi:MAG: hypothetical protein PHH26_07670 [Candidatus Thermoplasmatota archaeon]|nr:hypothetical protein [Candidatus Thermoplasmatota archaeon]